MENSALIIKKKNGDIISINVDEIESLCYGIAENEINSIFDPSVEDQLTSPLKFKIISNTKAAVVYDESYKDFHQIAIPPKVRIKGRVYEVGLIDSWAFHECCLLTSIDIPNSVTCIESNAFYCCTRLASIDIPDFVISIKDRVFQDCYSLESIIVGSKNPNYCVENGILYDKNKTTIIKVTSSAKGTYEMPYTVRNIDSCAFEGNKSLTKIIMSPGIREIYREMFKNCSTLTEIIIPASVTKIDMTAFRGCDSLCNIIIPASVKHIDFLGFYGSEKMNVYIDNLRENVDISYSEGIKNYNSVKFHNS